MFVSSVACGWSLNSIGQTFLWILCFLVIFDAISIMLHHTRVFPLYGQLRTVLVAAGTLFSLLTLMLSVRTAQ